jgi:hypothetical protein
MRRPRTFTLALAVGLIVLGAPVSPAVGAGFTLHLSAPSTPVVGNPMILRAAGTIPVHDFPFSYWFSLDAIPAAVTSTCPADRWVGAQLAESTGGSIVVLSQREVYDEAGNFSIPVGVTPSAPGSLLLCAYTDDGAATTLAATSLILNIQPAQSTRASIPAEAWAAIRSCRALLSGSGSRGCVRRAIRQANARCRRLPSPRKRATCLRAVRRVGRQS